MRRLGAASANWRGERNHEDQRGYEVGVQRRDRGEAQRFERGWQCDVGEDRAGVRTYRQPARGLPGVRDETFPDEYVQKAPAEGSAYTDTEHDEKSGVGEDAEERGKRRAEHDITPRSREGRGEHERYEHQWCHDGERGRRGRGHDATARHRPQPQVDHGAVLDDVAERGGSEHERGERHDHGQAEQVHELRCVADLVGAQQCADEDAEQSEAPERGDAAARGDAAEDEGVEHSELLHRRVRCAAGSTR